MGADYSFYVKSMAIFALTFFGYIISVLARVFVQAAPQASIWIKIKAEKSLIKFSFSSYLLHNRSTKFFANTRYLNFGVLESYTSLEKGFLFIFQNQVRRNGYQN